MIFDRIGKALWNPADPGAYGTVRRLLATELRRHAPGYAAAFAMMLLASGSTALLAYLLRDVINRIVADNQKRIFDRLLNQDVSFFSAAHTAEILMRFNAGAAAARDALNL